MITRELEALPKRDVYRILTSLVIPRPIAWISTVDGAGRVNLAPFSSFMGVFGPPMLVVTLARRKDGSLDSTLAESWHLSLGENDLLASYSSPDSGVVLRLILRYSCLGRRGSPAPPLTVAL